MVRVDLHGRRVGGWVVAVGVEPTPGVALKPIAKVTGWGPPAEVVDLARWAAWRWAGRLAPLLVAASPPAAVTVLPRPATGRAPVPAPLDDLAVQALFGERTVLRLPPAADPLGVVLAACARGNALVVTPAAATARLLAARLRRAGVGVALHRRDWAVGAAGATVVGTRTAAWAPVAGLSAVVVLDEHDEALQEEQTLTWHARDVAAERASRAGVPCVLVSPSPTLEALAWGRLLTPSRTEERAGWPVLEIVDRGRDEAARGSLLTGALLRHARSGRRVVVVLNAPGRARLLACAGCGELARCESCGASVDQPDGGTLACRRCGATRPVVCARCGATRLKALRVGTARLRDELAAAIGADVVEVTASSGGPLPDASVYVGTETALHQVPEADVVVFADLDAELLAPRYRAAEQAMALLARAARLVGGRAGGGRLVVQTHVPRHEVLDAVLHADPGRLVAVERERRAALGFPPFRALAAVSGPAAPAFVTALGHPAGVDVLGPADGQWLLAAADHTTLCDALAAIPRPPGRLRLSVDPPRV
jgi:primosomal protein N' (replication factor Y)